MFARRMVALIRMLLGGGFLWLGIHKLQDTDFLYGGLMHEVRRLGTPFPLYEQFLFRFVEFNQEFYALTVAIGETLVGLSLLLGVCVSLGTLATAFLVVNYALATTWNNLPMMAAHLLLAAALVFLGWRGAGLTWGLDRWLVNVVHERLVLFPWRIAVPAEPVRLVSQHPPGTRRPYTPTPPRKRP